MPLSRRADLLAEGVPARALDHLAGSRVSRPFRGIVCVDGTGDFLERVRAALLTQPPGRACAHGRTAGAVWRLAGVGQPALIELAVPPAMSGRRRRPGLRLYERTLGRDEIACREEIPTTTVARTLLELAATEPFENAVVAADSALRQGLCDLAELHAMVSGHSGSRGITRVRRVLAAADSGAQSPGETRLRLAFLAAGIPRPRTHHLLVDEDGRALAEGDLVDPERLLWHEYDGFAVHTQRSVFRRDRTRQRMLERRGWQVMRWTDLDLRTPTLIGREVTAAREVAPQRIAALRADLSPEVIVARCALGLAG